MVTEGPVTEETGGSEEREVHTAHQDVGQRQADDKQVR